jgi:hypothetical protein
LRRRENFRQFKLSNYQGASIVICLRVSFKDYEMQIIGKTGERLERTCMIGIRNGSCRYKTPIGLARPSVHFSPKSTLVVRQEMSVYGLLLFCKQSVFWR